MSKYDALFHQSPAFDALREAFLVFGDSQMTPQRLLNAIKARLQLGILVPRQAELFAETLSGWVSAATVDEKSK